MGSWCPGKHPHGRGEDLLPTVREADSERNTPTGVGKTPVTGGRGFTSRKHPHGRGEDPTRRKCFGLPPETPPRAWGRRFILSTYSTLARNTPTGVGKTDGCQRFLVGHWKHPHGRGEDFDTRWTGSTTRETPPRAWGRPSPLSQAMLLNRNTPTGVGKTGSEFPWRRSRRKHPHGRGEDERSKTLTLVAVETPPRAWGRLSPRQALGRAGGNTPTGVGKTRRRRCRRARRRKHPHGRGEDRWHLVSHPWREETPPRA